MYPLAFACVVLASVYLRDHQQQWATSVRPFRKPAGVLPLGSGQG